MNVVTESVLARADQKAELAPPEGKTEIDASLIELGKVSDTKGGFFGIKQDVGAGFITY